VTKKGNARQTEKSQKVEIKQLYIEYEDNSFLFTSFDFTPSV
jgi:hypothetical protein